MNIFEGGKSVNKLQAAVKLKQNSAGVKRSKKKKMLRLLGARALIVDSFIGRSFSSFHFSFVAALKKKNPLLIRFSERPVGKKGFTGNGNMSRGLALHTVSVLTRASCTVARGRY